MDEMITITRPAVEQLMNKNGSLQYHLIKASADLADLQVMLSRLLAQPNIEMEGPPNAES